MKIKRGIFLFCVLILCSRVEATGRFFIEGDGTLVLQNAKSGQRTKISYRLKDGTYPEEARAQINRVFGIPQNSPETIALRLIALLDHLQDHFKSPLTKIVSGYRSPTYNESIRKKGALAAKTSMHIEGMAADIDMTGVDGKTLWEYVRSLNCCGAGYYHATGIHVDVGNTRFWDEKTTKVDQDLGGHNKILLLRTDFDRYQPGDPLRMTVSRVTDYPISVEARLSLLKKGQAPEKAVEVDDLFPRKGCVPLADRRTARNLEWKIPDDRKEKDEVQVVLDVCDKEFPEMPDRLISNPIVIH